MYPAIKANPGKPGDAKLKGLKAFEKLMAASCRKESVYLNYTILKASLSNMNGKFFIG
jgi:hypothetical protein